MQPAPQTDQRFGMIIAVRYELPAPFSKGEMSRYMAWKKHRDSDGRFGEDAPYHEVAAQDAFAQATDAAVAKAYETVQVRHPDALPSFTKVFHVSNVCNNAIDPDHPYWHRRGALGEILSLWDQVTKPLMKQVAIGAVWAPITTDTEAAAMAIAADLVRTLGETVPVTEAEAYQPWADDTENEALLARFKAVMGDAQAAPAP